MVWTDQLNVEFWYRLLYNCLRGACYGSVEYKQFLAWLSQIWLWIIIIGYVLAILAFIVIIYSTIRLFELRGREKEYYATPLLVPDEGGSINKRWEQVESLIAGSTASEWREAIMEADIMLEEMLTKQGYTGESVGEKLKSVEPSDFNTLNDAWEAHKVRNQIAHEGSTFDLSETIARRTIARYENVFREFKMI